MSPIERRSIRDGLCVTGRVMAQSVRRVRDTLSIMCVTARVMAQSVSAWVIGCVWHIHVHTSSWHIEYHVWIWHNTLVLDPHMVLNVSRTCVWHVHTHTQVRDSLSTTCGSNTHTYTLTYKFVTHWVSCVDLTQTHTHSHTSSWLIEYMCGSNTHTRTPIKLELRVTPCVLWSE